MLANRELSALQPVDIAICQVRRTRPNPDAHSGYKPTNSQSRCRYSSGTWAAEAVPRCRSIDNGSRPAPVGWVPACSAIAMMCTQQSLKAVEKASDCGSTVLLIGRSDLRSPSRRRGWLATNVYRWLTKHRPPHLTGCGSPGFPDLPYALH